MPIVAVPVNFQEDFNTLPFPPVIINDLPNATETERRVLMNTISTTFEDDLISVAPVCDCGSTRGVPVGTRCHSCGTEVKSRFNEDVSASLWFRRPGGVEKLFHPYFWFQLKKRFTKSGFSLIQYLTDPAYTARVKTPTIVDQLNNEGFKRDYNFFIQNFWQIMDFLFSKREFSKVKKGQEDPLFALIKQNSHLLLSDYIPLPNKVFIITETSNMGVFIDPVTTKAKDVLLSIASIDRDFYEQDERVKRNRTARALDNLANFYPEYTYKNLAQKPGQIRKHWFGSRSNFSFRYVITSIEGSHRYDEIHVPWVVGLTSFRPHLLNKLKKMGYRLNEAISLLYRCVHKYDPLIERLLNELIQEAGPSGIPVQMQRN